MGKMLDQFLQDCTAEYVEKEYQEYKIIKTDRLTGAVRIQTGSDGVIWEEFEKDLPNRCRGIARRLVEGSYLFKPFREVIISKDPLLKIEEAIKEKKTRTLSIACLGDVLAQRIIYKAVTNYVEEKFRRFDRVSFGYRPGKSAPAAVRLIKSYIDQGYLYVLDADIKEFFDKIPHKQLISVVESFFNDQDVIIKKMFRRFIKVGRVEYSTYNGNVNLFRSTRPQVKAREYGIPQGGVLSGMVANMYLHAFDQWMVQELGKEYDLRYVRYADDFVVLLREKGPLEEIRRRVGEQLASMELTLHTDTKKTKLVDLNQEPVQFLGFSISPRRIRVKNENIERFKRRFLEALDKISISSEKGTSELLHKSKIVLFYKLLGNEADSLYEERICKRCNKLDKNRSWMSFFLTVTDVQQLKTLDTWIRKMLHRKYYKRTETRLSRRKLKELQHRRKGQSNAEYVMLEQIYYKYRKTLHQHDFCKCGTDAEFLTTEEIKKTRESYTLGLLLGDWLNQPGRQL